MDAEKILKKLIELWADQNNQQITSIEIGVKNEKSINTNITPVASNY